MEYLIKITYYYYLHIGGFKIKFIKRDFNTLNFTTQMKRRK